MQLDDFIDVFRTDPGGGLFMLDFDGTLSPIAPEPELATAHAQAPALLESLAARYSVVALVSGRRAEDLHRKIPAEGVLYVGLYGAERLIGGYVVQPEGSDMWRSMASRLARDAEALITTRGLSGCRVEFKDVAVSVHHRHTDDPRARDIILTWAEGAAPRRGFEVSLGRMVVEMKPAGVSKAATFDWLVTSYSPRRVLIAGDDVTDLEAMKRAKETLADDALALGVASKEQPRGMELVADRLVGSVPEMLQTLERFL